MTCKMICHLAPSSKHKVNVRKPVLKLARLLKSKKSSQKRQSEKERKREVPKESLQFYMHATFMAAVLQKLFTTRRKRKEKSVGGEGEALAKKNNRIKNMGNAAVAAFFKQRKGNEERRKAICKCAGTVNGAAE